MKPELISLFDLDGTLCDYDLGLRESMEKLAAPMEPPYLGTPRDNAPDHLRARANLIRASEEWWANLPIFKLGFDIWDIAAEEGYRRMVLTQGPRMNPASWSGKKIWIDRNLGQDVDVTITRDKGLVYGKVLVDDWPEYILRWLAWRPRGLVIMPAHPHNTGFSHPQVIRYDGKNLEEVRTSMKKCAESVMNGEQ